MANLTDQTVATVTKSSIITVQYRQPVHTITQSLQHSDTQHTVKYKKRISFVHSTILYIDEVS